MEYEKALKLRELVEEIEQNTKDIRTLQSALGEGNVRVQITIACNNHTYQTTIYEKNRLNILLEVLQDRNVKLMKYISEF